MKGMLRRSKTKEQICSKCGSHFSNGIDMSTHIKSEHMNEILFTCGRCDFSFLEEESYKKHLVIHGPRNRKGKETKRQNLSCSKCDKIFSNTLILGEHILKNHVDDIKYRCEVCGCTLLDEEHYNIHLNSHSTRKKNRYSRYMCHVCSAKFSTSALLSQHSNLHSGERPFACDQCDKTYPLKLSLAKHKAIKHNPNYQRRKPPRSMQCEECGKQFAYSHSLKTHMKTHSGEKPFTCNHCGRSLTSRQTLFEHVNAIHTGIKPFTCDVCKKSFVTEKILRLHKKIHLESKPFKCYMCSKDFTQSTALLFHMRYHLGHRPFACPQCNKSFVSVSLMKRHVRLSHEGRDVQTFRCAECDEVFPSRHALKAHSREHAPRLFICEECGRSFDAKSKYSRHIRGHSKTGLACNSCDKVLSSRSSLKRHTKVHLSELPCKIEYIVAYHPGSSNIT